MKEVGLEQILSRIPLKDNFHSWGLGGTPNWYRRCRSKAVKDDTQFSCSVRGGETVRQELQEEGAEGEEGDEEEEKCQKSLRRFQPDTRNSRGTGEAKRGRKRWLVTV